MLHTWHNLVSNVLHSYITSVCLKTLPVHYHNKLCKSSVRQISVTISVLYCGWEGKGKESGMLRVIETLVSSEVNTTVFNGS